MPLPPRPCRLALALGALLCAAPALAKVPSKQPTDPVRGRELYEAHCWQCHGPSGLGDGPLAPALAAPLASLRGRDPADWTALVDAIIAGRGDMPAHAEVMDRHDARRILIWLQALDQGDRHKDVQPTRGVAPAEPDAPAPDAPTPEAGAAADDSGGDQPDAEPR